MSRREPYEFAAPAQGEPIYWRSLEERAEQSPEFREKLAEEFPAGASELSDPVSRRSFLTLMSASIALAGLEGCIRRPVEHIVPYTRAPEGVIPGVPQHYATVMDLRGEALGLVVETHEGRPTKVEGNPDHPTSQGRADLLAQAYVLDLYDPDRLKQPMQGNERKTFRDFEIALERRLATVPAAGRFRVLCEPSISPVFARVREAVIRRFGEGVRFHTWTPLGNSAAREGLRLAFGRPFVAVPNYSRARVILSLGSDFLLTETGMVRATREYTQGRRVRSPSDEMNRLYVVEAAYTVTGSNADHRLRLPARDIERYALALAAELHSRGVNLGEVGAAASSVPRLQVPQPWLQAVAEDLMRYRGESLLVVGAQETPLTHAIAAAINHGLQNTDRTVSYYAPADPEERDHVADLRALVDDMNGGNVETLLILGGNPVYNAPADIDFARALERVPWKAHLTSHLDETASRCTWAVPRAHGFETWDLLASTDGTWAVQQPLVAPLYNGHSDHEILAIAANLPGESRKGQALVRATLALMANVASERDWRRALHRGVVARQTSAQAGLAPSDGEIARQIRARGAAPAPLGRDNLEVVFLQDPKLVDGRHANNSWLLEMPDPMSKITWDNAAYISPATASAFGLRSGDMVRLSRGNRSIEIAVFILPGQTDWSIGLPLGWGRTRAGRLGNGKGFDVYPLRTSDAMRFATGVQLSALGRRYPISQTQDHFSMEGRPIAIEATISEFRANPRFASQRSPTPRTLPLWREVDYRGRHKWGMVIDLNACTGCNACVVACQSENNVPVVGKDQVARGREMHWLIIDRYFTGSVEEPRVVHQPRMCVHCEEAPCENVCPVNATTHSVEGINEMTYNRCIGTRYCANNCPYKVRRFNYLNWHNDGVWTMAQLPEQLRMQHNPNVTVRFRGVMEKCTYCIQRIQSAKIVTRRENRPLRDTPEAPAIQTACAQTCPADAIVFGDLNDPNSHVSRAARAQNGYHLLGEIGTQPRTTHLARLYNPNPAMAPAGGAHGNTETHG